MTYRSIQGEDNINKLANSSMVATLEALKNEGLLTKEQVADFLDDHLAVFVTHDGGWCDWVKRAFKRETNLVGVFRFSSGTSCGDGKEGEGRVEIKS